MMLPIGYKNTISTSMIISAIIARLSDFDKVNGI